MSGHSVCVPKESTKVAIGQYSGNTLYSIVSQKANEIFVLKIRAPPRVLGNGLGNQKSGTGRPVPASPMAMEPATTGVSHQKVVLGRRDKCVGGGALARGETAPS